MQVCLVKGLTLCSKHRLAQQVHLKGKVIFCPCAQQSFQLMLSPEQHVPYQLPDDILLLQEEMTFC